MHLLALGAFWHVRSAGGVSSSAVVMHLLALGAFWRQVLDVTNPRHYRRNAPSGARCFLAPQTGGGGPGCGRRNAPSGARGFLAEARLFGPSVIVLS